MSNEWVNGLLTGIFVYRRRKQSHKKLKRQALNLDWTEYHTKEKWLDFSFRIESMLTISWNQRNECSSTALNVDECIYPIPRCGVRKCDGGARELRICLLALLFHFRGFAVPLLGGIARRQSRLNIPFPALNRTCHGETPIVTVRTVL